MGDGRGDLQRVWHEYVGKMFEGVTILDVGAGIGLSKARLSNRGKNTVTTQDIDRSKMLEVDCIAYLKDIDGQWDIVTAFDVIEHAPESAVFVDEMVARARKAIFLSTPNRHLYNGPWHFYPHELTFKSFECRYLLRYREGDNDSIEEVNHDQFIESKSAYALGVLLEIV